MLLKNLMSESLLAKLLDTRFSKPSKNVAVWKYYNATKHYYEMIRNERRNGCTDEYFSELLNTTTIDVDLPRLGLTATDFEDESCKFSMDERFWLSANEINAILGYCELWK